MDVVIAGDVIMKQTRAFTWEPPKEEESQIQTTLEGEKAESEKDCSFYEDGQCCFSYHRQKCPGRRHCNQVFVSKHLTDEQKEYYGIAEN